MGNRATFSSSSSFLLFHTPLRLHYLLCVLLNHLSIMLCALLLFVASVFVPWLVFV